LVTVAKDPKVSLSYTGGVLNEKSESKVTPIIYKNFLNRGVDYQTTTEQIIIPGSNLLIETDFIGRPKCRAYGNHSRNYCCR
jgi:hypothetical protein